MHFKDVLSDIEKLIGQELQSINPNTPSIYIANVDRNLEKYFVANSQSSEGVARSFRELEDIWIELTIKGFSNVDQALYGGGSSRHQPETVFAHLPYIQHFKYKNRKHLLLRNQSVHEFGILSELQSSELRDVGKKIDSYTGLSNQDISDSQIEIFNTLKHSLDAVMKKYPGDILIKEAENALENLLKLNKKIVDSIVTLDGMLLKTEEGIDEVASHTSVEDMIEDQSYTGVENTEEPKEDDSSRYITSDVEDSTGKTKIRQLTPVVSLIYDRLMFGEIELQPDFQRKDRVWSKPRKSKLIESMLMGLPLPVFYFAEKPNGDWIVVDGLQRITTIFDYMRGDFELQDLEVLEEFNGKKFSKLERTEQRKIREYPLTSHLIDMPTGNDNIIVELFHRINTYGVKLSEQEIRSALNKGSSVKFLRYLAASFEFKTATQRKIKSDRQKDMELCLSALSFMLQGYKTFEGQYGKYLSAAMKVMNSYELKLDDDNDVDSGGATLSLDKNPIFYQIAGKFLLGLNIAIQVFGEYTFKKIPKSDLKIPISKPLFELIVTYFSGLTPDQHIQVVEHGDSLINMLYEAISLDSGDYAEWESDKYSVENRGFHYSISTSTGKNVTVRYRFEAFREILKQSTGVDIELQPLLEGIVK